MVIDEEIKSDDSNERKYNLMNLSFETNDNLFVVKVSNYSELSDFELEASSIQMTITNKLIDRLKKERGELGERTEISGEDAQIQRRLYEIITRRNQFLLFEGLAKLAAKFKQKQINFSTLIRLDSDEVGDLIDSLLLGKEYSFNYNNNLNPSSFITAAITSVYLDMNINDYLSELDVVYDAKMNGEYVQYNFPKGLIYNPNSRNSYFNINWIEITRFFGA